MSQRSAAYPSYTILESLDLATKIYKSFSTSYRATREQIADALGYGKNSINIKLSTATQYGLLDMVSKQGYQVTKLFVQWHRPMSEKSQKEALVEAFRNPPLYQKLLQTFEGDILPPQTPLASILLHNHNISDKACDKAAEIFVENAKIVNALNEDRLLSFDNSDIEVIEEETIEAEQELDSGESSSRIPIIQKPPVDKNQNQGSDISWQDQESSYEESKTMNSGSKPIPHNIPLKNKLPAQLLLPSDVSSADFDFIISYIGLIRNQY